MKKIVFIAPQSRGWRCIAPSGNQVAQTLCDIESHGVQLIFASSNSWWSGEWLDLGRDSNMGPARRFIFRCALSPTARHITLEWNGKQSIYSCALLQQSQQPLGHKMKNFTAPKWIFRSALVSRVSLWAQGRKVRLSGVCALRATTEIERRTLWSKSEQ